jgi:hypothetical protein
LLSKVFPVQTLITPEIRSVIKHSSHLVKDGCVNPSASFSNFAFTRLRDAGALPEDMLLVDFSPCEYLPHLQQELFSKFNDNVTYENFVIVPKPLENFIQDYFGHEVNITGEFVSVLWLFGC